jgi:hypothetical protein
MSRDITWHRNLAIGLQLLAFVEIQTIDHQINTLDPQRTNLQMQERTVQAEEVAKKIEKLKHEKATVDDLGDAMQSEIDDEVARKEADKTAMLIRHEEQQRDLDKEQAQERKDTAESLDEMRKDLEGRHAEDTPEQKQQVTREFAKAEREVRDQQASGHEQRQIQLKQEQMAELDALERGGEPDQAEQARAAVAEEARQAAERAAQEAAAREDPER